MQNDFASIEFESQQELEELMEMTERYVKQNPREKKNETLRRFYGLLDVIHMNW